MELRTLTALGELGEGLWDGLVGRGPEASPFLSSGWLGALEASGCVATGRAEAPGHRAAEDLPHAFHLTLWEEGKLLAAAPAYLKGNSEGEFIFDHAVANAAPRFGVRYYPKLVVFVPFTPACGPRLLAAAAEHKKLLLQGALQVAEELGLSSVHVLFTGREETALAEEVGYLRRASVQFQFRNEGFRDFEDFLTILPSKKRTQIRRERSQLARDGVTLRTLRPEELVDDAVIDDLHRFYGRTVDQFLWGRRYLNRAFFAAVGRALPGAIRPIVAERGGQRIAMAYNLVGGGALWGRYWGMAPEADPLPFLHFNACYYAGVEATLADGLAWFSPGAGGEHKRVRGFYPRITNSCHYFLEPRLHRAAGDFFARERASIEELVTAEGRLVGVGLDGQAGDR